MTTRDGRAYDPAVWLHEAQAPDDIEHKALVPITREAAHSSPQGVPKRKSEARRQADLRDRQTQGDRRDWRLKLLQDARGEPSPLPAGYRLASEATLSQIQKTTRTRSIQKAIEKRKTRKAIKRNGRCAFRDPIREALYYGVRLDPVAVQRQREERRATDGVARQHHYPDERRAGPYPHEVALDRLCDWVLIMLAGDDPVIMSELAFRDTMRAHEVASYIWTGDLSELRAEIEATLKDVTPPPRGEAPTIR
jgi:hypothetical protein